MLLYSPSDLMTAVVSMSKTAGSEKILAKMLSGISPRSVTTSELEPLMSFTRVGYKAHPAPGYSQISGS